MTNTTLTVPTVQDIASRLMPAQIRFNGQERPLGEFVAEDRRSARERRSGDPLAIFCRFAAALLERNVSGASYFRRIDVFGRTFGAPGDPSGGQSGFARNRYFEGKLLVERDFDDEQAYRLLRESGYRYPSKGSATLVKVVESLTVPGFRWAQYLAEAEVKWESGFREDPLRTINGIGDKTRDFALSEFSDYYCAPDLHVGRMMARTGLILHGIGDPSLSTVDFGFIRKVIGQLARSTGWPEVSGGLSPAHIDRVFWYYGQDRKRCGATPNCEDCPANDTCLTGVHRTRPLA